MKIKIQITISSDEGAVEVVKEVVQLERGELCPEELGRGEDDSVWYPTDNG